MKTAYLIDRESVGGGCEYIRRKIDGLPGGDEGRMFCSADGECSAANVRAWGAEKVVINHLRAAVQFFRPFCSVDDMDVTFVVHGIHLRKYDWLPKTPANRLKRWLRCRLESWIYHKCSTVIALTETDAADIRRLYGDDLDVVIEPNTLDGWMRPVMEETFNGRRFDYVCIGRFNFQKGQDRLVRAMKNVKCGLKNDGRVLFIGGGETLDGCRRLADILGLADRCVFAGEIPDAERYLKCADEVVSPSRWEGMPYLMMKARELGCSILATDCPGNRDVLAGYGKWTKLLETPDRK